MTSTTIFDDRSPFIVYSPTANWIQKGMLGLEFNGTSSFCKTENATASLTFNGTSISVKGTIGSVDQTQRRRVPAPISLYSVDAGPMTRFQPVAQQNSTEFNVTFFQETGLAPDVNHTLVITVNNSGFFFLDWIQVDSTSVATVGPPSPVSNHGGSSTSLPNIIGAAIGTLCFIAILLGIIGFSIRRRRTRKRMLMNSEADSSGRYFPQVTPFVITDMPTSPPPYTVSREHDDPYRAGKSRSFS